MTGEARGETPAKAPRDAVDAIRERMAALKPQVPSSCWVLQHHLDEGTPERAYWHYGYYVALVDVLQILRLSDEARRGRP